MVVLIVLFFNSLEREGGLEGTDFLTVSHLGGSGGLERTDILTFYFRQEWWSLKNCFNFGWVSSS